MSKSSFMGARLQNDSSSPCRSCRKHQMVIVAAKQVTKFISFPGVHCEWLLSVSNKETTVDSYLSQIAIGPQSWINNGSQTSSCQHTPLKAWPTKLTIKWWILSQPILQKNLNLVSQRFRWTRWSHLSRCPCVLQIPSEKLQRAGKVLRNAILSRAPHMIRDRKYHLKTYRYVGLQFCLYFWKIMCLQVLGEAFCGCGVDLQKITLSIFKPPHSKYTVNSVFTCVLQTVLCRHRAGGLAGAAERLCAHSLPCCRDVAGTTRRRGAKSW